MSKIKGDLKHLRQAFKLLNEDNDVNARTLASNIESITFLRNKISTIENKVANIKKDKQYVDIVRDSVSESVPKTKNSKQVDGGECSHEILVAISHNPVSKKDTKTKIYKCCDCSHEVPVVINQSPPEDVTIYRPVSANPVHEGNICETACPKQDHEIESEINKNEWKVHTRREGKIPVLITRKDSKNPSNIVSNKLEMQIE